MLDFPKDHYPHRDQTAEWYYFWGVTEDRTIFFHHTSLWMKFGNLRFYTHQFSLHDQTGSKYGDEIEDELTPIKSSAGFLSKGERFNFQNPIFSGSCVQVSKPVIHPVSEDRNYYSIPMLKGTFLKIGEGQIKKALFWFDHEFSQTPLNPKEVWGWDWASFRLNSGPHITVFKGKRDDFATIISNGDMIQSDYQWEGDTINLDALGMVLQINPIYPEKIHDPVNGGKYSEQPINIVTTSGKVIGYGMRERTYSGGEDGRE